jgi:hypothetical protein
MKKFNMTSLMNKATKNRKSAEARAEEAKKAAQEARAAREAERKAAQEARIAKEAEEKAAREARAAEKKEESSTHAPTVSLQDAFRSFVAKGMKMMEQDPNKFWDELVALTGKADKANDQQMVFKIQRYYQSMQRAESLISRVRVLRERQKTVRADIKAKVMPWDQAAREAVVLASDAYGYPEIVKEAKKLLEDINRTK